MSERYGIEKAIAAALEPLVDAICDLEKKVEQLQIALEKATTTEQSSASTAEILQVAKR